MKHTRTTAAALTAAGLALASLATASLGMTSAAAAPTTGTAATAATPQPGAFVATTPTRAVDTRVTGGALGPGATRRIDLSGIVTSKTATAVVLNLTVANPTADGYLTVFPTGSPQPVASSINKRAGEIRSNSVTVALPPNGSRLVDVFNQSGSTQVIVDVTGWYDPAAVGTGATYVATQGGRPLDTRPTDLSPGQTVDVDLENDYVIGHEITAVAINLTAVNPARAGYLTAWNGVGPQPFASTVNYGTDDATPNFAIVPAQQDASGTASFRLQDNVGYVAAVVDVLGYYSTNDATGGLYVPVPPTRVTDTRTSGGALRTNEERCEAAGPGTALPANATSVNLNTTAVDATSATYLVVYGCGQSQPTISTLNPGADTYARANAAQPLLGAGSGGARSYAVYNSQGSVQFVADLQGWFVPKG